MLGIVLRLACSAIAVWLAALIVPGVTVHASTTWGAVGTVVLVALIFGAVNAVIKPVIKLVGCAFYVLTLGLISLVVNGLLFLLVSWICGLVGIPFTVESFWPGGVLGALLVSVVSFVLGLVIKDRGES
jgi:putative membrane protein